MTTEETSLSLEQTTMTETLEPKTEVTVSSRLRELADWLEANEVTNGEVTCCSVDGWGGMQAHLKQSAVVRICGTDGVELRLDKNSNVHGIGHKDGVRVAFCS